MLDDGASRSLAAPRADDPASGTARVFTALIVAAGLGCVFAESITATFNVNFYFQCATIILFCFFTRARLDEAFQPVEIMYISRAHQGELRPARSASGSEALLVLALVLRLRRVLLGSHVCEAARGCWMVHLRTVGGGSGSIVPHR